MNRIEVGMVYTAVRQKTGSKNGRDWELLATEDERGRNEIAVFVSNRPSNVPQGGSFRVEKINNVSYSNRKDQNGNWRANISIEAEVSYVQSFMAMPGQSMPAALKEAWAKTENQRAMNRFAEESGDDDLPF